MLVRGHVALDRHDELLASLGGVVLDGPEPVAAKTEANLQARERQFLWTIQLPPAAFNLLHNPAASCTDAKAPTRTR
jgi:hypothetical protein